MLRSIRILFLCLLTLLVLGFGTLVLLANVYEDEVKAKLVGALNERLKTPVTVSGMDLTLIARFPMASIRMHDVLVKEVRSDSLKADTLLAADKLFLAFNLWDLFGGDYTVQEIHASTVRLYPALDANQTSAGSPEARGDPAAPEAVTIPSEHVGAQTARGGSRGVLLHIHLLPLAPSHPYRGCL